MPFTAEVRGHRGRYYTVRHLTSPYCHQEEKTYNVKSCRVIYSGRIKDSYDVRTKFVKEAHCPPLLFLLIDWILRKVKSLKKIGLQLLL